MAEELEEKFVAGMVHWTAETKVEVPVAMKEEKRVACRVVSWDLRMVTHWARKMVY